jgi:hypothetical protein
MDTHLMPQYPGDSPMMRTMKITMMSTNTVGGEDKRPHSLSVRLYRHDPGPPSWLSSPSHFRGNAWNVSAPQLVSMLSIAARSPSALSEKHSPNLLLMSSKREGSPTVRSQVTTVDGDRTYDLDQNESHQECGYVRDVGLSACGLNL